MQPAADLLRHRSSFPVYLEHAAEIMQTGSANLGPGSIVVIPSLSGTTKEAIDVLVYAQSLGATVIALTGHADSPVAERADLNFTAFAEDDTSSESFYLQSLILVLSILEHRGIYPEFEQTVAQLAPAAGTPARRQARVRADGGRASPRRSRTTSTTSSPAPARRGPRPGTTRPASSRRCSGSARARCTPPTSSTARSNCSSPASASSCSRARTPSRPLAERVESWAPTITDRFTVIDAARIRPAGPLAGCARADLPRAHRDGARTRQRASRGPPRPPADHSALLPARRRTESRCRHH